jgi:SAM-dependent methyltransferase
VSANEISGEADPANERDPAVSYWNEWNRTWRFTDEKDAFMVAQATALRRIAEREDLSGAQILDVGCGTGWLGNELSGFGHITGTDLSPEAISEGHRRYPSLDLRCGDFLQMDLGDHFDLVLSSDSLVLMSDRAKCIQRMATLQQAGDVLVLMTMNPFVWQRRRALRPIDQSVPHASVDTWLRRHELKRLLHPYYKIESFATIEPGGDKGILFWVENRYVRGATGRLLGRERWTRMLERFNLGREFIIVARRMSYT